MVNTYFPSTSSPFLFTLPTSSLLSASPSSSVFSSISFRKLDDQSLADYTSWSPNNNQRRNLVTSENGHETSFNNESISSVNFYWEHRVATIINLYVPPFLVILGTICNCLVVLVMAGHWFSSVSTSVYMISGTIADTASLLIALPAHWVYVNFPDSIQRSEHSHIMCKFFNFFGWGSSDYGIILTVAMTIDKAIAILFPIKAQANCTTKRSKRVIFILFIFIVIKESHFLFVSNIVPPGRTEQLCTIDIPNDDQEVAQLQGLQRVETLVPGNGSLQKPADHCHVARRVLHPRHLDAAILAARDHHQQQPNGAAFDSVQPVGVRHRLLPAVREQTLSNTASIYLSIYLSILCVSYLFPVREA
ncbi:unnamed protein product [Acanthosepion pharaonis]|uniref:G-protein coupled receptors family 1 profile domain-containing protein n=1 Tax=Acanthosepion pharaonis TaxID=158019 RepID=A0A812B4R8_ACAPH|nr:unnamed protein product [Sepia pharaonis]